MFTVQQILDQMNLIMSDVDNELYKESEKITAINKALYQLVSDTGCFKGEADIQIRDIATTYEFPQDMIQLRLMTLDELRGNIIFNTTFESMFNAGTQFNLRNDLAVQWHAPGSRTRGILSHNVSFKSLVSFNQFMVDPVFELESLNPPDPTEIVFGP